MPRLRENSTPTSIRLDKNLLEKVKQDALKQGRSVTKQIEQIIIKHYKIQDEILTDMTAT